MVNRLHLHLLALLLGLAVTLPAAENPPVPTQREREAKYYRIVTLPTPPNVQFEAGALQFLGRNTLACSTRIGDIWIADNVLSEPAQPKWRLFESGLHEVLGLAWRDGWLYAIQRPEVTRLKDVKQGGPAQIVETYNDNWGINGDYHEFTFGSKFDPKGNLWLTLTLTASDSSQSPLRGWCVRITPEGKLVPVGAGVRSPGGMAFNAEGDLFYTDNQGYWNGTCKLQQIKPGAFLGNPMSLKWFDEPQTTNLIAAAGLKKPEEPKSGSRLYDEAKRIPELLPPSVYFPYQKMGQSASGIACDLSRGKFGPFKNQLFVGDQTHSTVMRVFLEKIGDRYQGACFPFREGFDSGNLALEFAGDGSLFVFGTERGWGSRGGKPFALQRLIWTGQTPFEVQEIHARPDGFELFFTGPVDAAAAQLIDSYTIRSYTYIYQSGYGSDEVDFSKPAIREVRVSANHRSVRLIVTGLVEGHVHEFHLPGIQTPGGQKLLHDAAYYTLNAIPAR